MNFWFPSTHKSYVYLILWSIKCAIALCLKKVCVYVHTCSVLSNSLRHHRLQPTRLLCPWNFSGRNTRVGFHFLLQGIFPTPGLNLRLLYWQEDSLPLNHLGSQRRKAFLPLIKKFYCLKDVNYHLSLQGIIIFLQ